MIVRGPVTVAPVQASSHSPGGTHTARLVTLAAVSHIGATCVHVDEKRHFRYHSNSNVSKKVSFPMW
jgi:hypothetical protein